MTIQTWLANELEFTSTKTYQNPFEDVDIDMVFTSGKKKMTFPGFWDGGNTWRVRFSLPKEGVWTYELVCTDKEKEYIGGAVETSLAEQRFYEVWTAKEAYFKKHCEENLTVRKIDTFSFEKQTHYIDDFIITIV